MAGLLLDTHALIWLVSGEPMTEGSLAAVLRAQAERALYVSSISAWEAGLAVLKSNLNSRPNLLGLSTGIWFRRAYEALEHASFPSRTALPLKRPLFRRFMGRAIREIVF